MLQWIVERFFTATPYPFYIKGRTDVVFLRTAHTGSSAVAQALNCYRPKETNFRFLMTAEEIAKEIGHRKYNHAFKFAFVRNPWDLLFADYRLRSEKEKELPLEKYKSFNDWILSFDVKSNSSSYKLLRRNQLDCLMSADGKIELDFIGRYENIQVDFEKVCSMINAHPIVLPKVVLPSSVPHYRDVYTPESKAIVDKLVQRDVEYFGYTY